MQTTWRLIPPMVAPGVSHMAIDEWLLDQHRLGHGPPCLRFYTWQPVAISLGYHQHHYPDHWTTLQWQGQAMDIVRRPSGGRAVLHQGDLTYSLVVSGYGGRRRDIYTQLCQFLIAGWEALGIALYIGGKNGADPRGYQRSDNCFSLNTAADLVMANGYKVIGSAQLYRDSCILQHGSIRLAPSPDLVHTVFGSLITPPAALVTIESPVVIRALTQAAERIFNIRFEERPLSLEEQAQALRRSQVQS